MTDYRLVETREELIREVRDYLSAFTGGGSAQVLVLADEYTQRVLPEFPADLVMAQGEACKDLESAEHIWRALAGRSFTRDDLLLAIGGGSVTDLCGFAAANYKRGCKVAYIPTTLLALVDASIGGKCAINLSLEGAEKRTVKNIIGTFYDPTVVFGCTELATAPEPLFTEGMGEVIKYCCLFDPHPMATLEQSGDLTKLLRRCIDYKREIVEQDPYDRSVRQYLNLGHTVAHALEGQALAGGRPIPHGTAVAAGLVIEGYFSYVLQGFSQHHLLQLGELVRERIPTVRYACSDYDSLWAHARQDKKNSPLRETVTCTLLRDFGTPVYGNRVDRKLWDEGLDFYKDLMKV